MMEKERMRVRLSNTDYVSEEQIESLLEVANEKMGTNFRLGIITQGWRCHLIGIKEFGTWTRAKNHCSASSWEPTVNLSLRTIQVLLRQSFDLE